MIRFRNQPSATNGAANAMSPAEQIPRTNQKLPTDGASTDGLIRLSMTRDPSQ